MIEPADDVASEGSLVHDSFRCYTVFVAAEQARGAKRHHNAFPFHWLFQRPVRLHFICLCWNGHTISYKFQ